MKRKWLTVTIIACIFGIVAAGASLHNYIRIKESIVVTEGSFCSISDFVNCDTVESSTYADIKGVPIAGIGITYYVLVLLFALYSGLSKGFRRRTVAFCWWSTIPVVGYSFVLGYVSLFILETICLTCIAMYLANITLFISLFLAIGLPREEWPSFLWGYWLTIFTGTKRGINFMPKFGMHLLVSIIVFGIGFLVTINIAKGIDRRMSDEKISTEQLVTEYLDRFDRKSEYDIKFNKDDTPLWGTKGAPVTIIEFSDYMCPYCKKAAFIIKPFLTEYKKDVAYYFINYPLDSECNHYMSRQMHPGACLAAKAAICADNQGRFWQFHDRLFKRKGADVNTKTVDDIAKKLKLDVDKFNNCLTSPVTDRKIKDDIETARRIYLTGTPSIFLNDRQLDMILDERHPYFKMNPYLLRAVVEGEIQKAGKPAK